MDVDGVPTLIGSTTGPGHAGLVFRVGAVDEPLARRGVTHLVEHLALHAAGVADYHRHVTDAAEYTVFYIGGTEAEIHPVSKVFCIFCSLRPAVCASGR